MTNWNNDTFMSDWDKKYVSTNLKPGAALYNKDFFLGINSELTSTQPELNSYAYAIIVRALFPLRTPSAFITGIPLDPGLTELTEPRLQHAAR
jgi:hypothetical protein